MPQAIKSQNVIRVLLDLCGGLLLGLYALVIGPLGVLRGPLALERTFQYLWVLCPQGLFSRGVRAAIDWRFGHFDAAISHLEGLVASCEEYFRTRTSSRSRRRVLEDLFTVLARAYLHAGHIDDAMLVVIRARKCLGVDRLPGLAELDAKTAHLVRAGLAAGRLLDGGGLATLFVKSTGGDSTSSGMALPGGSGASRSDAARSSPQKLGSEAAGAATRRTDATNVIPMRLVRGSVPSSPLPPPPPLSPSPSPGAP